MSEKEEDEMTTKKRDKVKPIGSNVLVRVLPPPEKSKGGIILMHHETTGRDNRGEVLAVGEGRTLDSGVLVQVDVKPGDVVLFDAYKIRLVIDDVLGYDVTASTYAKPGQLALMSEDAIHCVLTEGGQ